jgi:hypothetical protein
VPRLETVAATAGRPLTLTEQQSLAKHWVGIQKTVNTVRTTMLIFTLSVVTFVPYRRFPRGLRIFRPETINGRPFFRFPAGDPWAVAGWDSTRKTIQCLGALWIGSFIAVPFAEIQAATKAAQDPDLENLRTSMKHRVDAARAQGVDPRTQQWDDQQQRQMQTDKFQQGQLDEQAESRSRQEATRTVQYAYGRTDTSDDDASPTAGNEPWTGSKSNSSGRRLGAGSRDDGSSQGRSSSDWQNDSLPDSNSSSADSSSFDDASSTSSPEPTQPGSAWGRLRQQAATEKRGERWTQSQGNRGSSDKTSGSEGKGDKWW